MSTKIKKIIDTMLAKYILIIKSSSKIIIYIVMRILVHIKNTY